MIDYDDKVIIVFKNISNHKLNIKPQDLIERFRRGDVSRNTDGSGLGLSIAQSIVDLQHGEMKIDIDGDLFKATLTFDKYLECVL
jgi:signal transduction histidine kinase